MTPKDGANGFTLTELLIAIALAGILAGLSGPSLLNSWNNEKLNSASKLVTSWLEQARKRSLQNSTACFTQLQSSNASLKTICLDQPSNVSELLINEQLPNLKDISFTIKQSTSCTVEGSAYTHCVSFTPRGTTNTSLNLELRLGATGSSGRCIAVMEPIGLIRSGKLRSNTCIYTTSY